GSWLHRASEGDDAGRPRGWARQDAEQPDGPRPLLEFGIPSRCPDHGAGHGDLVPPDWPLLLPHRSLALGPGQSSAVTDGAGDGFLGVLVHPDPPRHPSRPEPQFPRHTGHRDRVDRHLLVLRSVDLQHGDRLPPADSGMGPVAPFAGWGWTLMRRQAVAV